MKVGDLVRVQYLDGGINNRSWSEPYHGFITMTPDDGDFAVWQMWCIEREQLHVLTPQRDKIIVISAT